PPAYQIPRLGRRRVGSGEARREERKRSRGLPPLGPRARPAAASPPRPVNPPTAPPREQAPATEPPPAKASPPRRGEVARSRGPPPAKPSPDCHPQPRTPSLPQPLPLAGQPAIERRWPRRPRRDETRGVVGIPPPPTPSGRDGAASPREEWIGNSLRDLRPRPRASLGSTDRGILGRRGCDAHSPGWWQRRGGSSLPPLESTPPRSLFPDNPGPSAAA